MTKREPPFTTVEDALEEMRAGRMIVLVDDEDRENEGDLTMAGERSRLKPSILWPSLAAD